VLRHHYPVHPALWCRRIGSLLLPFTLLAALPGVARSGTLPEVRPQAEGHYLETSDGRPFFWLGDTAWALVHGTTRVEASYYLRTRAGQGFTVIQVVALGQTPRGGMRPFVDDDPARPVDGYFDRLVEIVDEAAANGLYVALVPCWGARLTVKPGTGLFRLDNLPVARGYGRYLGTRLHGRTNVVWMLGGDTPAKLDPALPGVYPQDKLIAAGFSADADWRPIWREMAAGIAEGAGGSPVFLYHPEGAGSSSPALHGEDWLAINGLQSGHSEHDATSSWEWIHRDFALVPAKPSLDLEPNYEDHPVDPWPRWNPASGYFRDHDVRKQSYRSVFAGACGITYGHHAVWGFVGEHNDVMNHADRDWIDGLFRPGGRQMVFLRRLIESRPFFARISDPAMVDNPSPAPAMHIEACRDREGSYAFVYFPESAQEATIDLAPLGEGTLHAWWCDPRTGFPHDLGAVPGGTRRKFKSPSYGPDWVLVLDRADANYAAPGQVPAGASAR